MLAKLKTALAGWSAWTLIKKLAGRYVPVAVAGAVAFFGKWAPEGAAEKDVAAAVGTILWLLLETLRNVGLYALRRKKQLEA